MKNNIKGTDHNELDNKTSRSVLDLNYKFLEMRFNEALAHNMKLLNTVHELLHTLLARWQVDSHLSHLVTSITKHPSTFRTEALSYRCQLSYPRSCLRSNRLLVVHEAASTSASTEGGLSRWRDWARSRSPVSWIQYLEIETNKKSSWDIVVFN